MTSDEFFPLVVERAWDTTPRARAAVFYVPEHLRETFAYRTGQYIKVRVDVGGVIEEHAYSLCSSREADEPLIIAIKQSDTSLVAWRVQDMLRVGNTVSVSAPKGAFGIPLDPSDHRTVVLIAGGSGITPLWAIAKSVLVVEPGSRVVLVYANASADEVMFARELEQLRSEASGRLVIAHVLENVSGAQALTADAVYEGRISVEILAQTIAPADIANTTTRYLLCGPGGMIEAVSANLVLMGASTEHIHFESFSSTAPPSSLEQRMDSSQQTSELVTRSVKVRLYGQETEFTVQPDETILAAAQRANLDPPYACQIGACCTCRARLVSGTAIMDEREALSDDEIADGYILTCQAHPTSDGCLVDYDQ